MHVVAPTLPLVLRFIFMSWRLVAQIFNLPYRRFAIGWVSASFGALGLGVAPQNSILRYGRVQLCATLNHVRFMVSMHYLQISL